MPIDQNHLSKIKSFSKFMGDQIFAEAVRLYHSGGIDVESYPTGDSFALAKVLVTTAGHNCAAASTIALTDEQKEDLKNLLAF